MEDVVRLATNWTLKHGNHLPIVYACGSKGTFLVYLTEIPGEHEEKLKTFFFSGMQVAKAGHVGKLNKVFFVCEGWLGTNINIRPSADPKRIETLIIDCLDVLTNKQTTEMLEYVRDAKGNLIELKPLPKLKGAEVESQLLPAFVAGYSGH